MKNFAFGLKWFHMAGNVILDEKASYRFLWNTTDPGWCVVQHVIKSTNGHCVEQKCNVSSVYCSIELEQFSMWQNDLMVTPQQYIFVHRCLVMLSNPVLIRKSC